MAAKVGEFLKHDQLKLRFTQSNGQNGSPKNVIRRLANLTVAELIQASYMASNCNLLYYELLDVSIIELETKKSLKITWVDATNKAENVAHSFLLPKNTSVNEVASDWLKKDVKLVNAGPIRIFEIMHGRIQKSFNGAELVRELSDAMELFAEEIPLEELSVKDEERVISVYHFTKDPSRTHGIPFRFVLKPVSC